MRIDRRLLGWGLFLIIAGAIPLLVRGGYLDSSLIRGWPSLWPLLLIGWGLGLVLRRTPGEVIGSAISVAVLGTMVGGFIATGFGGVPAFGACGNGRGGTAFQGQSGTFGSAASVEIEFNCGHLDVSTSDGSGWLVSGSSDDGTGPDISSSSSELRIRPAERHDFMGFVDRGATWNVAIPRDPSTDLGLTLNAGDGVVSLPGANLDSLNLTLNAGSLDISLADAAALARVNGTVNAGSMTLAVPSGVTSANVTINAGSMTLCVPSSQAVRVSWSGALGSNNFDDAGLTKVDDQHWTTSGAGGATPYLELHVSANAGSFSLEPGGACNA